MTTLRATITFVATYEATPAMYGTTDPQKMAEIDMNNLDEDPFPFMELSGDWKVNVEVVPDA